MRRLPKSVRLTLVIGILAATVGVFTYYFLRHPEVERQLARTSLPLLGGLLVLYLIFTASIGLILKATLVLCRVPLATRESMLVTMYSAIINFFGPLQSGPAFRGLYLKKQHGVELKKYALATLAYYGFYGVFSVALLFSSVLKWWLVLVVTGAVLLGWTLYRSRLGIARRFRTLNLPGLGYLAAATLLQVGLMVVIYYLELRSVSPGVHLSQAITYAGAGNLALFVSLTPGAIGFRESFLVLSRHLHHIGNTTIVAANVIDRSVYIVMLLLLAVLIFGTHAQRRLKAGTEKV